MSENAKNTVLIIEDEDAMRISYKEVLQDRGFEVLEAVDGYMGLDVLAKNADKIDVVIIDLMMPGIDGLEVITKMNENPDKYGNPKVIVVTNMTSPRVIKEAEGLGVAAYLKKTDVDIDLLVKTVKSVLK